LFLQFEKANAVKNDLKRLGYSDAFVVAYRNGKRISLNDAFNQLRNEGKNITVDQNSTAGITINSNVPDNNTVNNTVNPNTANTTTENTGGTPGAELSGTSGMLFTVQIGVYSGKVNNTQLLNLKPIYKEQLPNGYVRYTAGIYKSLEKVKNDKAKVNGLGINDAFISAYYNGTRIKVTEALAKMASGENIVFPAENPIQFDATVANETVNAPNINSTNQPANNNGVAPFTNGVTSNPVATPDNGIKNDDAGITYKVQIGAFRNQVPAGTAENFLKIKTWPIKFFTVNDLFVYTIGSFNSVKAAKTLQQEAVSNGITDAFIIVLKDGKKLSGDEARGYLNQ
jgi:hypothetical protein